MTTQGELLDQVERWRGLFYKADERVVELEANLSDLEDVVRQLLRIVTAASQS